MSRLSGITHEHVQDFSSLADGNETAVNVTVPGVALGDFVLVSCSVDLSDLQLDAYVASADTVRVNISNHTGGAVNLGSATYTIKVISKDNI